jgi:phosphoglucomutase
MSIRERAGKWLGNEFDEETRNEVRQMLDHDEKRLTDAFYRDLEFGTGGLRGIMGAGTNRMNIYTLGMAAQGQSNYILKQFGSEDGIKVAIAHDCRRNSILFTGQQQESLQQMGSQSIFLILSGLHLCCHLF